MVQENKRKPHVIFIPYPLQGHVIPAVHFATKLASVGFTVTFVNTQFIHHQISNSACGNHVVDQDIFAGAQEQAGLDIRYATISDGFPVKFDRSLNHDQFMEGLLHVFPAYVDEFVGKLVKSHDQGDNSNVSLLIADTFFVWPSTIAKKYNLLYVSFWTEPALVLSLYYHMDLLRNNGHFGGKDNRLDTIRYIPGVEAIEPKDLMSYLQPTCSDISSVVHRIIYKAFEEAKGADFIIINSVQELEGTTIAALDQKQPTYAIGPIFPDGFTKRQVATSLWSESDCSQWLDSKPQGSVVYISFGSYAHTTKHVIDEIAHGLLQDGSVNFIWVVRADIVSSDDPHPLPNGFEEKVGGRGLVVPWCNQNKVLSHKAVGGFLTHCGWNSILESVWCEVPLLCFPLYTDQFTNRKLVVDDWKIGLNLCDGNAVEADQVSRKINSLVKGNLADDLRVEVKKVKRILEDAWARGGSSERQFVKFIDDVKLKIDQKSD